MKKASPICAEDKQGRAPRVPAQGTLKLFAERQAQSMTSCTASSGKTTGWKDHPQKRGWNMTRTITQQGAWRDPDITELENVGETLRQAGCS